MASPFFMSTYSHPTPRAFLPDHPLPNQAPVKAESTASPDLSSTPPSLHHFQYKFQSPQSVSSHASTSSDHLASLPHSIYRFGPNNPYNFVPPWSNPHPPPTGPSLPPAMSGHHNGHLRYDMDSSHQAFPYAEDYDEVDLVDIPLTNRSPSALADLQGSLSSSEKAVRRRSSKACDQCRKSKCKCERTAPEEPCKSCIMLGVVCTFLGPSRKRGPPKGYIDAIEARLHQTEALLGIIISSGDDRARTLLRDLAKDPLAREIINRVDNSPYGVKGRKHDNGPSNAAPKTRFGHMTAANNPDGDTDDGADGPRLDLTSTHPSNEWQDRVAAMLSSVTDGQPHVTDPTSTPDQQAPDNYAAGNRPSLRLEVQAPRSQQQSRSPRQRQRRRIEGEGGQHRRGHQPTSPPSAMSSRRPESLSSYSRDTYSSLGSARFFEHPDQHYTSSSEVNQDDEDNDNELTGAVGQLSLNEDAQLRYHGKSSGLYLLSDKVKIENRNEGGIWRFPKARVWPALPSGPGLTSAEAEYNVQMPDLAVQERLVELYFMYVQPCFPVIHKDAFFGAFRHKDASEGAEMTGASSSDSRYHSPLMHKQRSIPPLLLFAMFAIAARYEDVGGTNKAAVPALPGDPSTMWVAGDEYLECARQILDGNYATSRPSTCQALLLLGFREIGIGAMAQAWTYTGMAIRMAQDLGMHRCADKWARADLGGKLFSEWELNERNRTWYGCVIMDKYVSTYIGRPLMIFEQDFDTLMPEENDPEEWTPREVRSASPDVNSTLPVPGRIISCFNAFASLANILGKIVEEIYAVRPQASRHTVLPKLEGLLDKWYLELPEHLRFDPSSTSARQKTVLPHVLTLHMQYWCSVLLLHRAFIRHVAPPKPKSPDDQEDADSRASAVKSHELCAGAANHITTIACLYKERFPISKAPVFLCYFVFSASVMHASRLSAHPDDPQARVGLVKSMEVLEAMQVVWPSAGRALELMDATKASLKEGKFRIPFNRTQRERTKRSAAHMEDSHVPPTHQEVPMDYSARQRPHPHQVQARTEAPISYANDPGVYTSGDLTVQSVHQHHPTPSGIPATAMMGTEDGSQSTMNAYQSFERWIPPANSSTTPPSGPLSTSVLPQLYSTGLVDDRLVDDGNRMSSYPSGHGGLAHGQRQPQYWNDYSAYPQLGAAYGDLEPLPQPSMPHPAPQQQMYMPAQYNLYS